MRKRQAWLDPGAQAVASVLCLSPSPGSICLCAAAFQGRLPCHGSPSKSIVYFTLKARLNSDAQFSLAGLHLHLCFITSSVKKSRLTSPS